jgi:small conductance mechanosensitive channel
VALIVGLAVVALALLRTGTGRLAKRVAPGGPTPSEELQRRAQTLAGVAWNTGAGAIVLVAVMMLLPVFGVSVTPLVAAATVSGLALTLASQRLLKDVIAGAEFLADDVVAVGEWVTAASVTGRAIEVGLRALVLEGFDGTRHRIPNSAIATLANHSRNPSAVLLEVEVGFADDPGWLVAIISEEAERLGVDPPGKPWVVGPPVPLGVHRLGDDVLVARVRVPCVPFAGPTLARVLRDRIGVRLGDEGKAISPPFNVTAHAVDEPG